MWKGGGKKVAHAGGGHSPQRDNQNERLTDENDTGLYVRGVVENLGNEEISGLLRQSGSLPSHHIIGKIRNNIQTKIQIDTDPIFTIEIFEMNQNANFTADFNCVQPLRNLMATCKNVETLSFSQCIELHERHGC